MKNVIVFDCIDSTPNAMRKFRALARSMSMPLLSHHKMLARAKVQVRKNRTPLTASTPPNYSHTMCMHSHLLTHCTNFIIRSCSKASVCALCVAYYYPVEHLCEPSQSNSQPPFSLPLAALADTRTHNFAPTSIVVHFSAALLRTESRIHRGLCLLHLQRAIG